MLRVMRTQVQHELMRVAGVACNQGGELFSVGAVSRRVRERARARIVAYVFCVAGEPLRRQETLFFGREREIQLRQEEHVAGFEIARRGGRGGGGERRVPARGIEGDDGAHYLLYDLQCLPRSRLTLRVQAVQQAQVRYRILAQG